jgi:hypothetical protein
MALAADITDAVVPQGVPWWGWAVITGAVGLVAWIVRTVIVRLLEPMRLVESGAFVPLATHAREVEALEARVMQAIADRDAQVAVCRADAQERITAMRDDHLRMVAAKDSELDKVYMAWNLESEANRQTVTASQEQITAAAQLVTAMAHSVQEARQRLPEVARSDGAAPAGRAPNGA